MKNCLHKEEEKCWEKANLHVFLEKCLKCERRKEDSGKTMSSSPFGEIRMDGNGRMFLSGDEI